MTTNDIGHRCIVQKERIAKIARLAGCHEVYFGTTDQPNSISAWMVSANGKRAEFPVPTDIEELECMSDTAIEAKIKVQIE